VGESLPLPVVAHNKGGRPQDAIYAVPLGVSLFQSNYRSHWLPDDSFDALPHANLELLVHFTNPVSHEDWLATYYREVDANGRFVWRGPFTIEPSVVTVKQVSLADAGGF
jgi:hypothetical protein